MKFSYTRLVLLILFVATAFSCKKTTYIGYGVLPSSDDVGAIYTDTFRLITNTIKEDSVLTSSTLNDICGFIYDPVLGKSYAAIYTQLLLSTNDVNFGDPDTLYIDSVVLTLAYAGSYGYKNVPQTFNVYRVTQDMGPKPADGYYSNQSFTVNPEPIGRKELFVPDFTDSVIAMGGLFPPHMRIRLSDRFGQELLEQSGTANLSNDTIFKQYLKGICIAPDSVATPFSASMIYFNLTSLVTGLHLYWHTPVRDSGTYDFPIGSNEIRMEYFNHNYANTMVASHLQVPSSENDSVVFAQGAGGLKVRITIPGLDSLKNVVINKAEIVMTQIIDPTRTDSIFATPLQIVCVTSDSTGKDLVIPDALQFFPSPGGAKISKVTLGRQTYAQYTFSVATQLQDIVNGITPDRGLALIIYRRGESPDRIMAGGNNRSDNLKMKLNLVYTPIRQ